MQQIGEFWQADATTFLFKKLIIPEMVSIGCKANKTHYPKPPVHYW